MKTFLVGGLANLMVYTGVRVLLPELEPLRSMVAGWLIFAGCSLAALLLVRGGR